MERHQNLSNDSHICCLIYSSQQSCEMHTFSLSLQVETHGQESILPGHTVVKRAPGDLTDNFLPPCSVLEKKPNPRLPVKVSGWLIDISPVKVSGWLIDILRYLSSMCDRAMQMFLHAVYSKIL